MTSDSRSDGCVETENQLKILFVSSWGKRREMSPFTVLQADALIKEGIVVEHFEVTKQGAIGYLNEAIRLREYLKSNPVSLIHAHFSYCGWVADIGRRQEKLVVSYLGSDIHGYCGENRFKQSVSKIVRVITCLHARYRVNLRLVMSERMCQLSRLMGDCEVFPHGVDFDQYFPMNRDEARRKLGWPLDHKIILFPGNPKRGVKNFKLAEQSVALLRDEKVTIKVFGKVPEELMCCYYNAADVLLLTSKHEGSPCVIKEAMACNLPVVSTDVGDVKNIVGETVGCAVCIADPETLATAVAVVLKDCQRSDGRDHVSYLNSSVVAQKQIAIYRRLLSNF